AHRRGRSRGCAAGGGDELPDMARQVRIRSLRSRRRLPDQWAAVHRDWRGSARIFWSEAGGVGYAGFLAAGNDQAVDRWDVRAEAATEQFPGPDRKSASGSESQVARSGAEGGIP